MPKFEARLSIFMVRTKNLRVDQRLEGLNDVAGIFLQQRSQEIGGKRPSDAGGSLDNPSPVGDPIEPLGNHGGKGQRQITTPAGRIGCLFLLIDERENQIFDKERNAVSRLDNASQFLIRQVLRAWNGAGQFVALVYIELTELDHVLGARQVRTFWKGSAGQRHQNRRFFQTVDEFLQQLR